MPLVYEIANGKFHRMGMSTKKATKRPGSPGRAKSPKRPARLPGLAYELKRTKRPSVKRTLAAELKTQENGRGSTTRGWKGAVPNTKALRRQLKDRCGSKCFLEPDKLGYPICTKFKRADQCKPACEGLESAFVRSRQTGNKKVATKAVKLMTQYGCPR